MSHDSLWQKTFEDTSIVQLFIRDAATSLCLDAVMTETRTDYARHGYYSDKKQGGHDKLTILIYPLYSMSRKLHLASQVFAIARPIQKTSIQLQNGVATFYHVVRDTETEDDML